MTNSRAWKRLLTLLLALLMITICMGATAFASDPDDPDDPVLYPGWRGVNNDWSNYGLDYKGNSKTNLAIQGLFKKLSDEEIAALEADGYTKTAWGSVLVDNDDEYYKYLFFEYDYDKAPIYLFPFSPNTMSTGGFTNGYGFKNN